MRTAWQRCALLLMLVPLVAVGCAKRPALSTVTAPAPTGAAVTQLAPPPAPVVAPPAPPAPVVAAPAPPPAPAPAPALPPPAQFREVAALKPIYFDFDRSDIRPDAARILDGNIDWMTSHPGAAILIEGHCDERGTNEYNIALGERRATAAMNYLTARGVPSARITTISYGEERPGCTAHNEACWAKNRRAQFLTKAQ
jgi:peptidoglycan-associated lipoprotein